MQVECMEHLSPDDTFSIPIEGAPLHRRGFVLGNMPADSSTMAIAGFSGTHPCPRLWLAPSATTGYRSANS